VLHSSFRRSLLRMVIQLSMRQSLFLLLSIQSLQGLSSILPAQGRISGSSKPHIRFLHQYGEAWIQELLELSKMPATFSTLHAYVSLSARIKSTINEDDFVSTAQDLQPVPTTSTAISAPPCVTPPTQIVVKAESLSPAANDLRNNIRKRRRRHQLTPPLDPKRVFNPKAFIQDHEPSSR